MVRAVSGIVLNLDTILIDVVSLLVSSMQRMVNQFGTAQDSPELKQQL